MSVRAQRCQSRYFCTIPRITKIFLHNLSQRHVSALSWAVFRLNTFFCEVNHTVNEVMLLLSTISRVICIKFIHLKLITIIVKLKCYHNMKYTGCNRRNGPDFGRVFLRSNYTDIIQNTYIQSSMVTEILAREV